MLVFCDKKSLRIGRARNTTSLRCERLSRNDLSSTWLLPLALASMARLSGSCVWIREEVTRSPAWDTPIGLRVGERLRTG